MSRFLKGLPGLLIVIFVIGVSTAIPYAQGAEAQKEASLGLAQQIGDFYAFALGIGGLVALGILVYAGLSYTVAGGNASRQGEAKRWVWNALIGLGFLFGSFLILNTINPDLTKLQNIDLSQVNIEKAAGGAPQAARNLDLSELIGNFYAFALGIGGFIALGILLFAGILYTVSPGNPSRQGDAKTWIMSALVGLILLFGSYAILNTVNPNLTKLVSLEESLKNTEFGGPATESAAPGEPPKPGEKVPLGIAQQIGNFYQWALGIGGLIALGVLIFGGILYTISAGSTSRQEDAKNWLFGAIMGTLLLFGSYLILNTINPELTRLKDLRLIVNKAAEIDVGRPFSVIDAVADNELKKVILGFLRRFDPVNANAWFAMISCETRGTYNPNIDSNNYGTRTPDPDGACGLFQMDCGCDNPPDCGKGSIETQVGNAVALYKQRGAGYWDAADGVCGDGYNGHSILR